MRHADLVIFDCDGTLIDSERPANRVLAEYLGEYGLALTPAESEARFRGKHLTVVADELTADGIVLPEDWLDEYHLRTMAAFERELEVIPHALETVEAMAFLGIRTCVASQSSLDYLQLVLQQTGLWNKFEGRVFSASMVRRGKPHPDLFLHAAQAMRVGFDRCVVVEDSLTGVTAATAAGMRCLALTSEMDASAARMMGAEPIESLMEVPWAVMG